MNIVLHDYFGIPDGGGRLSLILAEGLGADLCYGFKSPDNPLINTSQQPVRQYILCPGWLPPTPIKQYMLARAFRKKTPFLQHYRKIVYSGSYAPLAVHNAPEAFNICYCHTPPRFVFDQKEHFMRKTAFWQRHVMKLYLKRYEKLYKNAMRSMDIIVANSQNVHKRISSYLGLDSTIINPPVDTSSFKWIGQEDFYLSTARLDPLKRVDSIIKAFIKLPDKKLVIVSKGSETEYLKKLASNSPNISIMGMVSEEILQRLVGTCIATVYVPEDEDFGMSPVESMAAGKPVIGVAKGGLIETVIPDKTGFLIPPEAEPGTIAKSVTALSPEIAKNMRIACEQKAAEFDRNIFIRKIKKAIEIE